MGGINMAIGTWLDPTTNRWVELYNQAADLPVTFPRGNDVAFIQATTDMSTKGRQLLMYSSASSRAYAGHAAFQTLQPRAIPMDQLPVGLGVEGPNGEITWTVTRPMSAEYYELMAEDGVVLPEPTEFITMIFVIIICAVLAYISYAIFLGPAQEKTRQAAIIAASLKIETDVAVDLNNDGIDDKRIITFANGTIYESPISDYGVQEMGSATGRVTNEGYGWDDFWRGGIPEWVWYAAAGLAIVGVSGAVYLKYKDTGAGKAVRSMASSAGKLAGRGLTAVAKKAEEVAT